jgi:uncharacterized protein YgiM (DUF1202 family)
MFSKQFLSVVIVSVLFLSACGNTSSTPTATQAGSTGGQAASTAAVTDTGAVSTPAESPAGGETATAPAEATAAEATAAPEATSSEVMTPTTEVAPGGEVTSTGEMTPTAEVAPGGEVTPTVEVTPPANNAGEGEIVVAETDVKSIRARVTLNVRNGPGLEFKVITSLRRGRTAKVTGTSEDQRWYRIECAARYEGHCWVTADRRFVTASK